MVLPLPNLNRPAFAFHPKAKAMVANRQCPTCSMEISLDSFASDLQRREYLISGLCGNCQIAVFGAMPKVVHFCSVGECVPLKQVDGADTGCDDCLASYLGDATKGIEPKGILSAKEKYFIGSSCYIDSSHECSVHGKSHMRCIEEYDKHEVWECGACGVTRSYRVRQWVLDGGPCCGYSEL